MYKLETLNKVIADMNACRRKYEAIPVSAIPLCISAGNRKIGRVMNVSLPPVLTCPNCRECRHFCYDIKACVQYPETVIDARIRNYMVFKKDIDEYFRRIDAALSRRKKNKYFRWHVSGDILSLDYFSRMVETARRHPDFKFWTYTKNYTVVNEYCRLYGRDSIPGNFSVMFSEWDDMPLDNPYVFPVFSCRLKAGNKNHPADYFESLYRCPGNCDVCKAAGRGCLAGENTFADEH